MHATKMNPAVAPSSESVTDKQIASLHEQISTIFHKLDGLESTLSLVLIAEEPANPIGTALPARTGLEARLSELAARLASVDDRIYALRGRVLL